MRNVEHGGEGALSKLSEELDKRVTSETRARRVRAPPHSILTFLKPPFTFRHRPAA